MSEIPVMPAPARCQRCQRYPLELKLRIEAASFAPGASIARVAREHGLNADLLPWNLANSLDATFPPAA